MTLLRLANKPLELANGLARWLYRRNLLKKLSSPIPVISVGNITMGGTGKTPLVEALARALKEEGAHPAIVTRGYRREGNEPLVLLGAPGVDWRLSGDEPTLLAKRLPQVPVVVDANRHRGCLTATRHGATHVLLDDGFQHFRLHRSLDLVVVSAADPLGITSLRREEPGALRFASRVVSVGEPQLQAKAAETLRHFHSLPPFLAQLRPKAWIWHGEEQELSTLRGKKVVAFAGIANPQRFFHLLAALGASLRKAVPFPDHHPYRKAQLLALAQEAERHGALLITTAKDHVRIGNDWAAKVAFLEVSLEPLEAPFSELLGDLLPPSGRIAP